jgi:hypothetical protein
VSIDSVKTMTRVPLHALFAAASGSRPAAAHWVSRIQESPSEDQSETLGRIYNRLRKIAEEMDSKPRVKQYGIKAVNAYTQARGPESLEVGVLTIELGRNAVDMGDYDEAAKLLDHGVAIVEANLAPDDPQLLAVYTYLVSFYEAAGDPIKQRRYRTRLKRGRSMSETANP